MRKFLNNKIANFLGESPENFELLVEIDEEEALELANN